MRLIFLMHMPLPGLILTECFMCCERPISVAIHSNGWESGCTGIGGERFCVCAGDAIGPWGPPGQQPLGILSVAC